MHRPQSGRPSPRISQCPTSGATSPSMSQSHGLTQMCSIAASLANRSAWQARGSGSKTCVASSSTSS